VIAAHVSYRAVGNGFAFAAVGHFLVGFGPMLWLICQTTVRQLVTPAPLMAGSTHGAARSMACGRWARWPAASWRPSRPAGGAVLIAVAFVLSTLVIVLSPLARLRALHSRSRLDY